MKAMILSAGGGGREKPLTKETPKPLIKIHPKKLI
jgi:CTP:phosphocholine cytidylyltransferase-like protein